MNAFEKFQELYKEAGVQFEISECLEGSDEEYPNVVKGITLWEGGFRDKDGKWVENPKVIGYSGFVTTIAFDKDGNFVYQKIVE